MEVIELKENECLLVGEVGVSILRIGKVQVRLGIHAPREKKIVRSELLANELDYLDDRVEQFKRYMI